ncbi:hypothetical protein [Hymenobacter sp. B81]|uniref:DUF7668 domain-containing protein n=1 Tax=Hymenobacter sp. B81 TaxID=3344878 RepID=UPI0037DCE2F6
MDKNLEATLDYIVANLVAGNYQRLLVESQVRRMEPEDIQAAIAEHGQLTLPPAKGKKEVYVTEVRGSNEVHIDYFLWVDGSLSDLMVRIVAYQPLSEGKFSLWDIYAP